MKLNEYLMKKFDVLKEFFFDLNDVVFVQLKSQANSSIALDYLITAHDQ